MSRVRSVHTVLSILGLALGLTFGPGEAQAQEASEAPETPALVEIAPGVLFAAQPHTQRFNDANVVFLLDPAGVVAIDAPTNAEFLSRAIEELRQRTEAPLRMVVNTHWHEDHTLGNAKYRSEFGNAFEIVGHRSLSQEVPERAQSDYEARTERWQAAIEAAKGRLTEGVDREGSPLDATGLQDLAKDIEETQEMVDDRRVTRILPPTLTYGDRLTLDHAVGPIELIHHRAHTRGDTVVYLPSRKVLITGDLLDALPYGGHGFPKEWTATLEALAQLDFEWILPGHGPAFRGREQLERIRDYIGSIVAHAEAAVAAGQTLEQAQESLDLAALQTLLVDDDTAQRNWNAFVPATLERAFAEASGDVLDP